MRPELLLVPVRGLLTGFGRFTTGQKAATLCTIVALVVGGVLFSSWSSKPTFAPLYSNLAATDASAIVDKLRATGIPYQLADGGQTIMVPQDKVYDLRLTMSGQGLPAGKDTGYALLDKQGLTASEFMQHVDYQRALEGELDKTIEAIGGVQSAIVHLAIPPQSVFTDTQQKPTASVLVASTPGQALSTNQVQGVVHLVSSSVVSLDPSQVTVTDATGTVLSAGGADAAVSSAGASQGQQTLQYEQRMNSSLQQMLDQVVGTGHAVVKVTADLNYDQTSTKSQTYVSNPKTPPLSQSSTAETYTGSGTPAGGVLGPDNIQVPNGGSGTGKYAHTTVTQDNAVGVVTQTTDTAPGTVRRLGVAVLLDNHVSGLDTVALSKLVANAVGLQPKRGDTMALTALPFDQAAAQAVKQAVSTAKKSGQQAQLLSMAKTGGMVLLVLVLLFVAWRSTRKRGRPAPLTADETAQLDEMQAALERSRAPALGGGAGALALGSGLPNSDNDRSRQQHELVALVERQPEDVAQLLRGWLADRRELVR